MKYVNIPPQIDNPYWAFILKPFNAHPKYELKTSVAVMLQRFYS